MTRGRQPYKLDDLGHAAQRFVERCVPGLDPATAARRLLDAARRAFWVADIDNDQELWRGQDVESEVLLVVKDGEVKTVLAPGSWDFDKRRRRT